MAGLTAARALARRGRKVLLLEARNRVGGRIHSVQPRGWPRPAELGAEFVHEGNAALKALLKRAGLARDPVETHMWWSEGGELSLIPEFWERIGRVADKIPVRNLGWSFERFLKEKEGRFSDEDRRIAATYVASFNAADPAMLSAHALRDNRAGADGTDFSLSGGYSAAMERLREELPPDRVVLQLRSEVRAIHWSRGSVAVHARTPGGTRRRIHHARAVIITLPVGVLQSGRVVFSPPLGRKCGEIDAIGWGSVVRITMRFSPNWWTRPWIPAPLRERDGQGFGFVNAPAEAFPVWWALHPPTPVLTGWAGGEPAEQLACLRPAVRLSAAIRSLAHVFQAPVREIRRHLRAAVHHDWTADPYSMGAYSHVKAGCENASARLARSLAGTLFFAGEATAQEIGTVHGAMESGERAAREAADQLD